jgi:hypothetical protein
MKRGNKQTGKVARLNGGLNGGVFRSSFRLRFVTPPAHMIPSNDACARPRPHASWSLLANEQDTCQADLLTAYRALLGSEYQMAWVRGLPAAMQGQAGPRESPDSWGKSTGLEPMRSKLPRAWVRRLGVEVREVRSVVGRGANESCPRRGVLERCNDDAGTRIDGNQTC